MPVNLGLLREIADDWPAAAVARTFPVAQPNVGTDWTVTVPGESVWGVVSIAATLVTSAVAASRVPTLRVTDGVSTLMRFGCPVNITTGLTTLVSWVAELGYASSAINGATVNIGLPPIIVPAGSVIAVTTTAIDAGDQWSAINLNIVEVYHGHLEAERERLTSFMDRLEALTRTDIGVS